MAYIDEDVLLYARKIDIAIACELDDDKNIQKAVASEIDTLFLAIQLDFQKKHGMSQERLEGNQRMTSYLYCFTFKESFGISMEEAEKIFNKRLSIFNSFIFKANGINEGFWKDAIMFIDEVVAWMITQRSPSQYNPLSEYMCDEGPTCLDLLVKYKVHSVIHETFLNTIPTYSDYLEASIKIPDDHVRGLSIPSRRTKEEEAKAARMEYEKIASRNKIIEGVKEYQKNNRQTLNDASIPNTELTDDDTRPMNTEITDEDLWHEVYREADKAVEHEQWLEEKKRADEERRRQAEKEKAQSKQKQQRILKPSIYLFPIMLAVASLFDMPSWFYTFFKIIVLIVAVILIGIRLNEGKFRSEKVAIGTVYMAFMAVIGILSFINGGFPRSFWMFLDIGYCIMHVLIYIGFIKGGNSSD